jgi:hypothetical protein
MTTTPKLSASNFTDPLIQVLGKLSGYQAGTPISHKDTYAPIMELMGIKTVEEHGFQDPNTKKRPFVTRWISWAYRNARVPSNDGTDPAWTVTGARGKWALTADGVARARQLNGEEAEVVQADDVALAMAMVEEDTRMHLDAATRAVSAFDCFDALVEDMTNTGYIPTLKAYPGDDNFNDISMIRDALTARKLEVFPEALPTEPRPEPLVGDLGDGIQIMAHNGACYHTDPYIVALASSQTQCFGSFSPRSGVCGRCPLQGACLNVVRGKLAELARGFQAKLVEPAVADDVDEDDDVDALLAATLSTETPEDRAQWDQENKDAAQIKAASDSKCYRCGDEIAKGTKAWWHRDKGLFHDECY